MPEIETISCPATPALSQRQVSQRFPTLLQQLSIPLSRQDRLDGLDHLWGVGFGSRAEPVDHRATGREQELLEVPLHVACLTFGVGGLRQLGEQRVTVRPVDIGLGQQRKRDAVGGGAERLVLVRNMVAGLREALPAYIHHARSQEICVTVGKLWARCGHGSHRVSNRNSAGPSHRGSAIPSEVADHRSGHAQH